MATILTKKSDTASAVPLAADLTNATGGAELAVNATDKRLFSKTSGGTVVELGTNPSSLTLPNGTANGLAFLNASKVVTSNSIIGFDGTNIKVATSGITANSYLSGLALTFDRNADNTISAAGGASSNLVLGADNVLKFNAAGSEGMRLTSTGLGIGTSSPSAKLDLSNTSRIKFNVTSTTNSIEYWKDATPSFAASTGTGTATGLASAYKVDIFNGSTWATATTIDSSGNLGLGVTPSAWQSGARAQQMGATYSLALSAFGDDSSITTNAFYNTSSNWVYQNTASTYKPTRYNQYLGNHIWSVAASTGTAGSTITWSESARIDSSGNLLLGTTSNPNSRRFITSSSLTTYAPNRMEMTSASGQLGGLYVVYTAQSPNDTSSQFIGCDDSSASRFVVRSNGGIANYSANNVNLSDRREKTNFAPATSYLDKICAIPVQTFNYIDQNLEEDGGLTLGVVAQDVQAVAPELVMESNWGTDEAPKMRLSIYQTDLQYALMKALQELKAEFDAYKASHP